MLSRRWQLCAAVYPLSVCMAFAQSAAVQPGRIEGSVRESVRPSVSALNKDKSAIQASVTSDLSRVTLERAQVLERFERGDYKDTTQAMRIFRMYDDTPLIRPSPLNVLKGERDAVLGRVSKVLRAEGFQETARSLDTGEMRAVRRDSGVARARDEVLIWTDGQAGDASRIRLYFEYGRYEPVTGKPEAQRIKLDGEEAQQRIGKLKQAIIDLGQESQ